MKEDKKRVNVVLPVEQIDMLKRIAKRERRSLSSVLREAIEEFTGVKDTVFTLKYDEQEDEAERAAIATP